MFLFSDFNRDFLFALFSGLMYSYLEIDETIRITREGLANGNVTDVFVNGTSLLDISKLRDEGEYWLTIQAIFIGVVAAMALLTFPLSGVGCDLLNFVTTGICASVVVVLSFLVIPFTQRTVDTIVDSSYVTSSNIQLYGSIAVNCLFILNALAQYKLELQSRAYKRGREQLIATGDWEEEQEEEYREYLQRRSNLVFIYDTLIVPQQQRLGLKPMDDDKKLQSRKGGQEEDVKEGIESS